MRKMQFVQCFPTFSKRYKFFGFFWEPCVLDNKTKSSLRASRKTPAVMLTDGNPFFFGFQNSLKSKSYIHSSCVSLTGTYLKNKKERGKGVIAYCKVD